MSAATLKLECPHCGREMEVAKTSHFKRVTAKCLHWDCRFEGWVARSPEELVEMHADELLKEVA